MSSPNHPTSDIEDAFFFNSPDYILASSDYFPTLPRITSSDSLINSSGLIPIASPTLLLSHDDPYIKIMQAFYAKESPIPPQNPITPQVILTPSLILPPSPLFDTRYFFVPKELLPPKKQIHPSSSSSTTLSSSSRKQAAFFSNSPDYILASPDYFPTSPRNTSSDSSLNSSGLIPIASPTSLLSHDDPYIKIKHAFYAKESPIPPPNPITPPVILTSSLVFLPSPLFDPRYLFVFEELLPPKKQIHPPSSSLTTLSNSSLKQACILVPPSFLTYTPTPPHI
nr:hypothetical protein [Tanacetum cinerariifolium]